MEEEFDSVNLACNSSLVSSGSLFEENISIEDLDKLDDLFSNELLDLDNYMLLPYNKEEQSNFIPSQLTSTLNLPDNPSLSIKNEKKESEKEILLRLVKNLIKEPINADFQLIAIKTKVIDYDEKKSLHLSSLLVAILYKITKKETLSKENLKNINFLLLFLQTHLSKLRRSPNLPSELTLKAREARNLTNVIRYQTDVSFKASRLRSSRASRLRSSRNFSATKKRMK